MHPHKRVQNCKAGEYSPAHASWHNTMVSAVCWLSAVCFCLLVCCLLPYCAVCLLLHCAGAHAPR